MPRSFIVFSELSEGDAIVPTRGYWTCLSSSLAYPVHLEEKHSPFIYCIHGKHSLVVDDDGKLFGFRKIKRAKGE
jgi:hypothetical protein